MDRIVISLLLVINSIGFSQHTNVYISTLDSSIVIGQPFDVITVVTRPFLSTLICPDTNSNFYPFDFNALKTFESKLVNDSTIKDSAIYTLISYKTYKTQDCILKVGLMYQDDSTQIVSNKIELRLNSYIEEVQSGMKPKSFTPFHEYQARSYVHILQILGVCLAIILIVSGSIVAKKIYKQKKIKKLQLEFDSLTYNHKSREELYDFVNHWKKFIEQTTRHKITAMTTTEMKSVIKDEHILTALANIDSIKYNPNQMFNTIDTSSLTEYANQCLTFKIKELNEQS